MRGLPRRRCAAERQIAQSLSGKFRRTTDSLQLPPEVQRRVLAALADQRRAPGEEQGSVFSWRRLAWPLGLAASVLLLLAGLLLFRCGRPGRKRARRSRTSPEARFRSSFRMSCRSTRFARKADS